MIESESRQERAARYRRMAEQAEEVANKSKFPQTREDYLKLARDWKLLAEETEKGHPNIH